MTVKHIGATINRCDFVSGIFFESPFIALPPLLQFAADT